MGAGPPAPRTNWPEHKEICSQTLWADTHLRAWRLGLAVHQGSAHQRRLQEAGTPLHLPPPNFAAYQQHHLQTGITTKHRRIAPSFQASHLKSVKPGPLTEDIPPPPLDLDGEPMYIIQGDLRLTTQGTETAVPHRLGRLHIKDAGVQATMDPTYFYAKSSIAVTWITQLHAPGGGERKIPLPEVVLHRGVLSYLRWNQHRTTAPRIQCALQTGPPRTKTHSHHRHSHVHVHIHPITDCTYLDSYTHTHTLYKHPDCTLTLRHLCSVLVFTSCYQAFWIVIVYLVLDCLPGLPGTWFLLLLDLVYAVCWSHHIYSLFFSRLCFDWKD